MYQYILEARKTKAKYDYSLRLLLGRYSIKSEIELVSGNIVDWPKYINPDQKDEFIKRAQDAFSQFRSYWRQAFYSELGIDTAVSYVKNDHDTMKSIQEKAAAWYYVTYHPSEFKNDVIYNSTLKRYLSFPWTVDEYIANIAIENNERIPSETYIQAIPSGKIEEHAARLHKKNLILYDDESDEESDDESGVDDDDDDDDDVDAFSEEEEVHLKVEQQVDHEHENSVQEEIFEQESKEPEAIDSDDDDDDDEVPVLNVRLSDLL
jgi:hypothetical protein